MRPEKPKRSGRWESISRRLLSGGGEELPRYLPAFGKPFGARAFADLREPANGPAMDFQAFHAVERIAAVATTRIEGQKLFENFEKVSVDELMSL